MHRLLCYVRFADPFASFALLGRYYDDEDCADASATMQVRGKHVSQSGPNFVGSNCTTETRTVEQDQRSCVTGLAHVGGHFDEQSDEQVKRCVGELGAWALGSAEALGESSAGLRLGMGCGRARAAFIPSLQRVSKSLPIESPGCNHNC